LNFLGLPPVLIGFVVVLVYLIFAKNTLNLNNKDWAITRVKVFCLITIFGLLDMWSRNILFFGYMGYNIIISEKKLYNKEHKKDEKTEKKDDKKDNKK